MAEEKSEVKEESKGTESTGASPEDKSQKPQTTPPVDMEALIAGVNKAIKTQVTELGNSLRSELGASKKQVAAAAEGQKNAINWDDFYSKPEETMRAFAKEVRNQVVAEISEAYNVDNSRKDFWMGFYEGNPHLKGYHNIVNAILTDKQDAWAKEGINVGEAYTRMADIAEEIGGKLGKKKKDGDEKNFGGTIDGIAFIDQPAGKVGGEKVRTISDIIRERQAKFSRVK